MAHLLVENNNYEIAWQSSLWLIMSYVGSNAAKGHFLKRVGCQKLCLASIDCTQHDCGWAMIACCEVHIKLASSLVTVILMMV